MNLDALKELEKLEPYCCPNCAQKYSAVEKDVKRLEPENAEQLRWHCFCGACGAIYVIEVEP
jgi:hypothetical protein